MYFRDIVAAIVCAAVFFAQAHASTHRILTGGLPTSMPTSMPTSLPTSLPTSMPSASAVTASPTMAPTTSMPTMAPTTRMPTMAPSMAPTTAMPSGSPTMAPTFRPGSTVVEFNATFVYTGINATIMNSNVNYQRAARQATADATPPLTISEVMYVGATDKVRRLNGRVLSTPAADVVLQLSASIDQLGTDNATAAYEFMTGNLSAAVSSGQYTTYLQSAASSNDAPDLSSTTSDSVTPSSPVVYSVPESGGDDDDDELSGGAIAGIVIACVVVAAGLSYLVYTQLCNKSDADESKGESLLSGDRTTKAGRATGGEKAEFNPTFVADNAL